MANNKFIDLTGMKFGKLTVIKQYGKNKWNSTLWECQCECGNIKHNYLTCNLLKGDTISCGCHRKQNKPYYKHGMTDSRLFHIWSTMKRRCYAPESKDYNRYGGRGIIICDEWLDEKNGFTNFMKWALSNGYQEELTIERIDNDSNYCPDNCRWATYVEQANNKRSNVLVELDGMSFTLSQLADYAGLKKYIVYNRHKEGLTGFDLIKPVSR